MYKDISTKVNICSRHGITSVPYDGIPRYDPYAPCTCYNNSLWTPLSYSYGFGHATGFNPSLTPNC